MNDDSLSNMSIGLHDLWLVSNEENICDNLTRSQFKWFSDAVGVDDDDVDDVNGVVNAGVGGSQQQEDHPADGRPWQCWQDLHCKDYCRRGEDY